jgi:hypothetical protein
MATELKTLLTPELFKYMVDEWIPFSKSEPIDFGKAIGTIWFEREVDLSILRRKLWPALKALSLVGLDNIPDFLSFLPPPEDAEFPVHALGLLLIVDQGPRALFEGVDVRWTYAHFGEFSTAYLGQLAERVPADAHPASWARWRDTVSLDYFVFVRLWFGAPLWHHEKMAEKGVAFTDETRQLVEHTFKTRDPYRDEPDKRWHLFGFPNMLKERGPKSPCDITRGTFWISCLMDVHKPPLDLYGRYPWQNYAYGREDTPEEAKWLEASEIFVPDPKISGRIRSDVEAGIWTPLGDADH